MKLRLTSFDLRAAASDRYIAMSALLMFIGHALLWQAVSRSRSIPFAGMLNGWDSSYYTGIASDGYVGVSWAFFPFYPLLVRAFGEILPLSLPFIGALLSVCFFSAFVIWMLRIRRQCLAESAAASPGKTHLLSALWPKTRLGWIVFIFAPGSYIFHSHHTESLYVLLMLAAFYFFANEKWVLTAVVVGLAALTKNQGVLLACACGVAALGTAGSWPERLRRFAVIGGISGALFALFPLYQYIKTGNALTFVTIQHHWRPEITLHSYLRTFWFGNSWQNTNIGSVHRLFCFFLLVASLIPFALIARHLAASLYMLLHIAIMPMSGEFVGVFRYGTVLFPLLFFMGDQAAFLGKRSRLASYLLWPAVLLLVWYNFGIARRYALGRWSY